MKHESEAAQQVLSVEFAERFRQARDLAKDLAKTESLPGNARQAIADLLNAPAIMVFVRCTCASRG